MASDTEKQIEIVERLQTKLLERFETLIDAGEITSTDMATLCRLLTQNGWNIDPARVPKGLLSKLTQHISPEELAGGGVLPFKKRDRA